MRSLSQPRTRDEIAQLGMDWLKRVIEPSLPLAEAGRCIVVDVNTGEYEIDDDDFQAVSRLRARVPGSELYACRVGEDAADRIGLR